MSKDVAQYIYDLVKNDKSDEQILKELYKRVHEVHDDENDYVIIHRIDNEIKRRVLEGYTHIELFNYILIKDYDVVLVEEPENAMYTYKISGNLRRGQIVYITKEIVQKIIKEIVIPLDLNVSIEYHTTFMRNYYNIILSWDHWEK